MTKEISGRGNPVRALELLWGRPSGPKRGPKPKASRNDLVDAAIAIADTDGIDAVSTRRVSEAVGISAMSFYTHIPGKAELLDLMLDRIAAPGNKEPEGWAEMGWRERMGIIAETMWAFHLQHPWVVQVQTHRPVLGPNTLAAYEVALSSVDGIGLDEIEMDLSITALFNYVAGAVRDAARAKSVYEATGMSDDEWWYSISPFLESIDYAPYPVTSRVGPVAGTEYGAGDPERAFRFGLERFLDGMELMIARKQSASE